MGKITAITRQKKNKSRVSIFIGDDYFGSLDEKTFLESGLKTGDELSDEKWRVFQEQGENQLAFNKGISYISKLMRSKKQVKEYLLKKGYDEPAILYAIDKMSEYKYIDDEAFAKMVLSHQINVKKVGLIAAKDALRKNGISKNISESVLEGYDEDTQFKNARQQYEKLLKKYLSEEDDFKKRHKISQAMARRGFNWDMIKRVSRSYEETS